MLLALCGLLAGCGAKRRATQREKGDGKGATARNIALPEQFVWTLDPEEMMFLDVPVSGSIHGKSFVPEQVQYHGGALRFRRGKAALAEMEVEVPLGLPPTAQVEGKRITAVPGKPDRPPVLLAWTEPGRSTRDLVYVADYALKVEFDKAADGKVPGRIYLCVADEAKSYLAGSFSLETGTVGDRSRGPAGPADAPFVRGTITVKGQEKGMIEVGYVGQPDQGEPVSDVAGCSLLSGAMASSETFAPRSTRLDVSGTNRAEYLCRQLPPGRYFFYVGWKERGMAWRWVDVRDGGQLAVDFTIDPGRTGSLQVKLPPTQAAETVLLVPLEDGRFPVLPFRPALLTQRLKTEARVEAGEAKLDRLPEGAYRVLVGDDRAQVQIRAGAVTRLDMTRSE
jgi:hypothetical protein